MPLFGKSSQQQQQAQQADTPIYMNETVTDTASDIATAPTGKDGMVVSIWNDGPSPVAIAFDATATPTSKLILNAGEGYAEGSIRVSTRISAISLVAGQSAVVRGTLWCG